MQSRLSLIASLLLLSQPASALVVIDDFSAGSGFATLLPNPVDGRSIRHTDAGLPPQHTIGGMRSFWFDSCTTFGGLPAGGMPVIHSPVTGAFVAGGTPASRFCEGPGFEYGGEPFDDPLQLGLDLTGYNAVVVDLTFLDPGDENVWFDPPERVPEVYLRLTTLDDDGQVVGESAAVQRLPTTDEFVAVPIPFAALGETFFGGPAPVDLSEVDAISIYFQGLGDGGLLGLSQFSASHLPALDGDYNGDGSIDQVDHDRFVNQYGLQLDRPDPFPTIPFGSFADGNGDGVIDAADYTVWRDAMDAAASRSVPEPSSQLTGLMLLLVARMRSRSLRQCLFKRTVTTPC